MHSHAWKLAALAAVLSAPASSFAQDDPIGIDAGILRMHPGAFLESTYDSNYYYQDTAETADGDLADVFVLKPGLTFRVETPDPGPTDWSANLRLAWEQYLGADNEVSEGGVEAGVDTALLLFRESIVSLRPHLAYTRVNGPADDSSYRNFNQHSIDPGLELTIQPEGGKVFSEKLGWAMRGRFYDEVDDLNNLDNRFSSATKWNFLPQTAVTLLLEQHIISYFSGERTALGVDPGFTLSNINSMPFRVSVGLQGLLLDRLDFVLAGGYGYTFYDAGSNEHVILGRAELGYEWQQGTKFTVGYARDFGDSSLGNYYTFHRIYTRFQSRFLDRFEAALAGRVNFQSFAEIENLGSRSDLLFDADVSLAYSFIPGLKAKLAYVLRGDSTDFGTVVGGVETSSSYLKHLVVLNLAYEY